MIEKMQFLSITGPKTDIDRVADTYLSRYEIHLEPALSVLKSVKDLRPYTETSPYREVCEQAEEFSRLPFLEGAAASENIRSPKEAAEKIAEMKGKVEKYRLRRAELLVQQSDLKASIDKLDPFLAFDYELKAVFHFDMIKVRFGRIPRHYYSVFKKYIYDNTETILCECKNDENYVWIVYFVPGRMKNKVDAIYSSMHFERIFIPDEYDGTPSDAISSLTERLKTVKSELAALGKEISAALESEKKELSAAAKVLKTFSENFQIRKMAACTGEKEGAFYILCGFMKKSDADKFQEEVGKDKNVFCTAEKDCGNLAAEPPTVLKNPKVFRPFQLFIEMYGLPSYREFDPTVLIGILYSFLFGFMFGDVGQGLCLLVGGYLLYRFKKVNLTAIISCCGFFSTIFGFLFGSVFGFEDVIGAVWLRPLEHMTSLPFIGKLNTVFVVSVSIGMGIILLAMVLNIINGIRFHDTEKTYFDTNGVAGLVFYAAFVLTLVLYMTGRPVPASAILVLLFGIPLLLMFFKEPLANLAEKKARVMPEGKGMFVIQGFFELFEVLLSYFSNTLSFVRVGAFAVSHAAMMEVVLMLSGAEAGSPNWAAVILGNLFICAMEGLIVGIQVLRLQYYELFSRFYKGTGRAFQPYGKKN